MISTRTLARIVGHAERSGAKVIVAGDTGQLQAVENGGGMTLLADTLGYVQLAEPVRFAEDWEKAASLRLRTGDASVLADYDEHGRITGGEPEAVMDGAARAYVALRLQGRDVLLMAADHARRRELSRRIRDDLIHLGLVDASPSVRIADGARASIGDLIVCTENDHGVEAGTPGRTLANGDLLKIEAIAERGLIVRRALPASRAGGGLRWTDRSFLYGDYHDCELGYAVTDHVAQSRTVDTGLALITGTEDRQHAYVAMTRGRRSNAAFVFTTSPKIADPAPGPRPAPELARFDRLQAGRQGQPGPEPPEPAQPADAVGVLADVLSRDGLELAATQVFRRGLSNADHLAILNAIWIGETAPARDQRYRDLLTAALPAGHRQEFSHKARWLWRTLHAAELAGLDAGQVLRDAVAQRGVHDAQDIAAVIDSRIRRRTRGLVPLVARPWSERVPSLADQERQDYVAQIAQLMDQRKERLGEHAAQHELAWAVGALGPVPDGPVDRLDWQQRASSIAAYRELYGYDHPAEAIGPEPVRDAPEKQAAWHEAFRALRLAGDAEVRAMPDGELLHLRSTYPVETAWAPPWVGDELRQVRHGAQHARLEAIRARAEAAAAQRRGRHDAAARHRVLSRSYQAMAAACSERETIFAQVMEDRRAWEQATADRRRLAVAADAELRRRNPGQRLPALRSAEPDPAGTEQLDALTLRAGEQIPDLEPWIARLAEQHAIFTGKLAEKDQAELPEPNATDALGSSSAASYRQAGRQALLQPPRPQIPPSARIRERVAERDAEMEAAT